MITADATSDTDAVQICIVRVSTLILTLTYGAGDEGSNGL
jgi:hypothetical protein